MKSVSRVCGVLALSVALSSALFADDPAKPRAKPESKEGSQPAASEKKAAGETAPAEPTPASEAPPAAKPAEEKPTFRPIPATTATLGLFTLETGDTLPRKGFAVSTYANKISREPGSVSVLSLGWNVSFGLSDRISTYFAFEPHRHVHVSRPGRLSFNSPVTNPQFEGVYRSLTPVPGTRPGYVEDFPFIGRNGGGLGEVTLGLKFGLLSERKGKPVSLSVRTDFILPTHTTLSDVLESQNQTGEPNYNLGIALSKTFRELVLGTLNWDYRITPNPHFHGDRAMRQADQIRTGAGFLIFPEKRLQLVNEYTGLIFVGDHTPDTTFAARDPFEILAGVRVYPWRNLGVDLGYRRTPNLKAHGDQNGFVVKLGSVIWPGKPTPPNRPPVAACSADKTMVYAGSDDVVNVAVRASDPDGDPLTYSWSATGGRIEGSGPQVKWDSAGVGPGLYTVSVRVDDGRGGTGDCSVEIRVEPRPNRPPTLSCSVDRSSVIAGERVRIHGEGYDPDGDPLTYAWRTNGGQIVGSGSTVQLDTSGLAPGRYTVSGRVDDGRGGAADCAVEVNVQAAPPAPQASKVNECLFRVSSARVDNVCKRILDDVALRLQKEPKARSVIVGYADPKEPRHEKLAAQRAEAARKYLGEKGIAASRIDTRAATGQAGAGKQNRRIDVIWVPEGATY